jgi:hypothetical protein
MATSLAPKVTIEGTVISHKIYVIEKGTKMVVRAKVRYQSDCVTDDTGSTLSIIETEFWDNMGEAILAELQKENNAKIKLTGELFQRRWTEGTQLRAIHRVKVSSYQKIQDKPSAVKATEGKYAKYKKAA